MWTFGALPSETLGFSSGVWFCQCNWTQNLPRGQDVRFRVLPILVCISSAASCSLFFFLIHLSYCCHNPIPMSARRTKCKYLSLSFLLSFSLSSLLLCCSPWNLFYPVHQCAFAWQTGILLKLISLRRFNKQNCSLRLTNVFFD